MNSLRCRVGMHEWATAESPKWIVKVCKCCGERRETEKFTGGYSPRPDPIKPTVPSEPPTTTGTISPIRKP